MELAGNISFLAILCFTVLMLCPFVRGGCQEELMQDSGFMECVLGFGNFFSNLGSGGMDMSDPDGLFKTMCSPEGRAALTCIFGYMKDCPELTSGSSENPMASLGYIPGFDLQMFMEEGGMDGGCALMVGPCNEVKKCFSMSQGNQGYKMAKRSVPPSINYYNLFHTHSDMMCGGMKEQMICMLKALESCPSSVVNQVEAEFEKAIGMSIPGMYGVVSFKDSKHFIQNTCSTLPKGFLQDTCSVNVYATKKFTMCNENVKKTYSVERSCEVHDLSKRCITENVQPKCGKEIAMFLIQNTHMIFPGIPGNCDDKTVSGSDVEKTSFGLLLMSTIFTLSYI